MNPKLLVPVMIWLGLAVVMPLVDRTSWWFPLGVTALYTFAWSAGRLPKPVPVVWALLTGAMALWMTVSDVIPPPGSPSSVGIDLRGLFRAVLLGLVACWSGWMAWSPNVKTDTDSE